MLKKQTPLMPDGFVRLDEDLETGRKHPPGLLTSDLPLHGFIKEEEPDAMPGPARMIVSHQANFYQIIRTGEAALIGRQHPYTLHPAPLNATARIGHVAYAVNQSQIYYGEAAQVEAQADRAEREASARQTRHPSDSLSRLAPVVVSTRTRTPVSSPASMPRVKALNAP